MYALSSSIPRYVFRLRCLSGCPFDLSQNHIPQTLFVVSQSFLHSLRYNLTKPILQVRAAEDILSLTRILKESWLFGKLETVGISDAENQAEEAARKVAEGLSRLSGKDEAETQSMEEQAQATNSAREVESKNGEVA